MNEATAADPEPTTDAEAEAALFALGARLCWEVEEVHGDSFRHIGQSDKASYYIDGGYWRGISRYRAVKYTCSYTDPASTSPRQFSTVGEAKIACERFDATGKWE